MDSYPEPPPQYRENIRKQPSTQFRVARKPVAGTIAHQSPSINGYGLAGHSRQDIDGNSTEKGDFKDAPDLPPRPELSVNTLVPANVIGSGLYLSPEQARTDATSFFSSIASSPLSPHGSISPTTPSSSKSASSYAQKAYREARHFAGGLIAHPYENTKHCTILRHSHGLVFYQGSSTTLAVSIFADTPLPADRTLWLQSKGWTGKTGMRAKAFIGRNGDWLNVTPSTEVTKEQLKPENERAWQRDIAKFCKKADRHVRNHILRETVVVRIPAEASDGYFQLVLCVGEKDKVLCPSPVFRVLSTSASPSSLRGASLTTLPLELGALALGTYAKNTAGRVISPVTSVVQSQVQNYMPSWKAQEASTAGYSLSGVSNKFVSTIKDIDSRYDQVIDEACTRLGGELVSMDEGADAPYPIHFFGRCQLEACEHACHKLPTLKLRKVPQDISQKLHGYYFGWARVVGEKAALVEGGDAWHQALISALILCPSQLARASITEATKKFVSLRLISDYESLPPDGAPIEVQVMGFLRPDEPSQRAILERGLQAGDEAAVEAAILSEVNDISVAQSILDHPAWSMEAVQERKDAQRPGGLERVKTGYINTRLAAQRQMDRVPFHKFGVRMPGDQMKDKTILANGFFVVR